MGSSVRSYVIAGVTAIAAGVIAIPPSVPSAMQVQPADVRVAPSIDLAASVRSLVTTPPNPEHFAAAKAAIARIDPAASATLAVQAAVPVPLNAASDWIVSGYQFIQSWVTYGVQLADYALQFIPYGSLISGQINIFYYNLILPISDSIVYGLVVPVVNEPLNPSSYINGLITVGQTTVNAAINTGIAQFSYFFGWLIPPLPPLPLAAAQTVQPQEAVSTLAAGLDLTAATAADVKEEPASLRKEKHLPAVVTDDVPDAAGLSASGTSAPSATPDPPATADPPKTPERPKTTTDGVQTQGEVRGGTDGTDDATTTTTTTTTKDETSESTSATAGTDNAPATATESASTGSKGPAAAGRDKGPRNPSATNKGAADKGADEN